MADDKFSLDDVPKIGGEFSKAESGQNAQNDEPPKKQAEEKTYDTPKLILKPPTLGESSSVSADAVSRFEELKSIAKSEAAAPTKEGSKNLSGDFFTDNPIKTDVRLGEDFENKSAIINDMEVDHEQ